VTAPAILAEHVAELEATTHSRVRLEELGNQLLVIVEKCALPKGLYTAEQADLLLITDFQYPHSAMDMFWLEEGVTLRDGRIPGYCSAIESYGDRRWRRWSWHRNGRWTPGVDDLLSHFAFVQQCWAEELRGASPSS